MTNPRIPEPEHWEPTKWWRVLRDDTLWAETSDEDEARAALQPDDVLQRMWTWRLSEWRTLQ